MFTYDNEYTEQDWRFECLADELAERDRDRHDMEEYPAPLTEMEAAESRKYAEIGPLFADEAGPIGMSLEDPRPARKHRKKAA